MTFFTEYIALDIGTHSLKFFSLDPAPKKQGFQLHTFFREELPPGMIYGGFTNPTIDSISEFSGILRNVIGQLPSLKEGMIIGLPDRWVKLHLISTQFTAEEAGSPGYLTWRLKKLLCPPNLEEVLVDYQIVGKETTDEGTTYSLVVGLVKKSLIDILSNIFQRLRVQVMTFDTSTLGVFSLLELFFPDRTLDKNLIFCHIGHETTVVKVFHKGVLNYERVIEVGGEAFCQLFCKARGSSPAEGEKIIIEQRFFPISREDIVNLIEQRHLFEEVFGNWLRELKVTFRFYQEKFKVQKLPPIYLTGGSSLFYGMPEFLTDFFRTPCQRFNPLAKLPCSGQIDPGTLSQGPQMAPAIGLLVQ